MATTKRTPSATNDVTLQTLKLGPKRLLTFLQGASDPAVRGQLARFGWSERRVEEAWSLLRAVQTSSVVPAPAAREADPAAEAMASCEAWQATGLVRARALLQLTHAEQATFLFHDFEAGPGTAAVLNVETFLQRLHALEKGADRKARRKADHEALHIIDESGTTKEQLKELQAWVVAVQTAAVVAAPEPTVDVGLQRRTEALRALHAWLSAWSEVARTVVTRRDQMIRLGIAKRRPTRPKLVTPPPTPPQPARPPTVATSMAHDEPSPESRAA